MREDFVASWARWITGTIENTVRHNFSQQDLRQWPLLRAWAANAYELPEQHMVFVLRDRLSGFPITSDPVPFPYSDHPTLPPKVEEIELWQFYLKDKLSLREEDAAFVMPIRDSGEFDAAADYELFSAQEKMFWNHQMTHVIGGQAEHLLSTERSRRQPSAIVYNIGVAQGSIVGNQQYADLTSSFDFGSARSEIEQRGGNDAHALEQMMTELEEMLDRGEALPKGKLARYGKLMNRNEWVIKHVVNSIMRFATAG